ncbi:hypothetical protein [Pseudorhodoferax soli]|uniref:Major facilitator superfamily (MFS) profile domain-containing protein n=1 Tax=Pseudorhodoferax soli TaxID=545864 RepID=A0A368XGM0_9BURK|nr:hypothetical protein DES41_11268 [Pseudorhodoferax soli]
MADRLGRKRLFLLTLVVHMAATTATAFTTGFGAFVLCRFATVRASAAGTRPSTRP